MIWSQPLPLPPPLPQEGRLALMAGRVGGEVVLFGGYFMTFVPTISVHTLATRGYGMEAIGTNNRQRTPLLLEQRTLWRTMLPELNL